MNVRVVVSGIALTVLGVFIPFVGWFFLLPIGLIVIVAGLIIKEEPLPAKLAAVEPAMRREDVLLDVDLVASEMEAIARKMPELSLGAKTNVELADQYATCLKDAESRIVRAGHLEDSLIQTISKGKQDLQATESTLSELERSREVYGVETESLETKIAREESRLDELRADVAKWRSMLRELRAKRKQLAVLASSELGTAPERIGVYARVLMKYKEKYGEAAERKLKRDLALGGRSIEQIHNQMYPEKPV